MCRNACANPVLLSRFTPDDRATICSGRVWLRFWITKNGRLSIREQLVRQVILAIVSDELPAGQKLPSIRSLARRYHVHSNTVSAAYHQLLEQGWLQLRRGSGLYVRSQNAAAADGNQLDALLNGFLRAAHQHGYEPSQVLERLTGIVAPRPCNRVVLVESEAGMREILLAEMGDQLSTSVESINLTDIAAIGDGLVVSLPSRAPAVRRLLPDGTPFLMLRLRSVRGALEREKKPPSNAIISIVSSSPEFRQWAVSMLIAVGLEPACLCEVDTALDGWQKRAGAGALAVADIVAARHLPKSCDARVFRVISDASLAEMRQSCHL